MNIKQSKRLRKFATEQGIPYEVVKKVFKKLNKTQKVKLKQFIN